MNTNTREAIRLLGAYTAGRFDIWILAGSARASCRAHVLSALTGKKVPQRMAGVTALRSAFYTALEIAGECEAHREENFVAACKQVGPTC